MNIIRAPGRAAAFTVLPNALLRDRRLSWKARGLLAYLLSHVDGWQADAESLAQQGPDGRSAILAALKELEHAGYLQRRKRRTERGRWATDLLIYDTPQIGTEPPPPTADFPTSEDHTPEAGKPQVAPEAGSPTSDKPAFGQPAVGEPAAEVLEDDGEDQEEHHQSSPRARATTLDGFVAANAVTEDEMKILTEKVIEEHQARNPRRYLAAMVDSGDLAAVLTELRGERAETQARSKRSAFLAHLDTQPDCGHGALGGHIADDDGWVRCPILRNRPKVAA